MVRSMFYGDNYILPPKSPKKLKLEKYRGILEIANIYPSDSITEKLKNWYQSECKKSYY